MGVIKFHYFYYHLQIQLSAMITQPPKNKQTLSHNQTQNFDKQQRMHRCEEIAKLVEGKIQDQIINGQVKLRKKPLHIELTDDSDRILQNPERSIREKISSLNTDLETLQKQITIQKEKQRERDEQKKREASILIERLRRQKQQHRSKLRLNQLNNRLKSSVLSEDVLKLMRERRESLVQQKKKDMQLRIYKNLNRKIERQEDQNKNQISYWTKIKQIQDRKRSFSTKLLPSIRKVSEQPQFGVNMDRMEIKNSNFAHKRSFSKQQLTLEYHDVVNKFLERAKAKKSQSKSQKSPINKNSMMITEVASQKNQSQLQISKISSSRNEKMQKIVYSYIQDKRKLLGNEYLKQSLLKVDRTKSPRFSTIMDNNSFAEQSLQLKGNPAFFHKNDKVTYLEDRREKLLQGLASSRLEKSLAVQMLGPVQSRLDKVNPEGIEKRLKQKLQIFEQVQKKNQQVQRNKPSSFDSRSGLI